MTDEPRTTVDWSRPIQFANGEPLVLLDTLPDGRRLILRPNEPLLETSAWEVPENGSAVPGSIGERMGCWVVNRHG